MLRYTKLALLVFGAGLLVGLAAVTAAIGPLGPLASGLMTAGILGIPLGLVFDCWHAVKALRRRRRPRKPRMGR